MSLTVVFEGGGSAQEAELWSSPRLTLRTSSPQPQPYRDVLDRHSARLAQSLMCLPHISKRILRHVPIGMSPNALAVKKSKGP